MKKIYEYERAMLFDGVERQAVDELLAQCEEVQLSQGDVLLSPQASNTSIYYLVDGQMSMHLDSTENPSLDTFRPGECVGELSFLDGMLPSAYVVADESSTVLRIDADLLTRLVESSHRISINLIHILTGRMRSGLNRISDTYQEYMQEQQRANTDALTGLNNRRWLERAFPQKLLECQESGRPACFLMADVDYFKKYNDSNGHLAGDQALIVVSEVLRHGLKYTDLIARFGGEEFAIFLPDVDKVEALEIAHRLCSQVERSEISLDGRQLPSVTISVGLAELSADQNADELMHEADGALYRAKSGGRNRVET